MIKYPLVSLDSIEISFQIRKGFFRTDSFTALKDISLSVFQGETLGIIGRNGSGKSTLLKIISGIYQPSKGAITLHKKNAQISLLSLNVGIDTDLPGITNILLSSMFMGFTKKQTKNRIERIVQFAELEEWIHAPLKTYSTGMRARLGFALVLEMGPDILLIDEVLGVGDQKFKAKSKKAMKDKLLSHQTVILVSHSIPDVRELCSQVAWFENGRLQMLGETEEVTQAYLEAMS